MTLDVKAMEWASAHGIDTAKLKAAKIPIYGKWYFPDIPPGVPLVNLQTGEIQTFGPGMRAGEILYVARADLMRARLGPYAQLEEEKPAAATAAEGAPAPGAAPAPETSPGAGDDLGIYDRPLGPGESIHLPSPSIFPLVLALGLAIAMVGIVAGPVEVRLLVILLGLVYLVVGGTGWVLENYRDGVQHEEAAEHGHAAAE